MKDAQRRLRDGTRAEHERLDALFAGFDLADREGYTRFLRAHAEALLPVEAALDPVAAAVIADWPGRRRGDLLLADLAELGLTRHSGESWGLPEEDTPASASNPSLPWGDGSAEIAGALYVVEGSRLGGRFLAARVGAGLPTRYLGAEQPRGSWPALLAALDRALPDAAATDRAVAAARAVFARFEAAGRALIDDMAKPAPLV